MHKLHLKSFIASIAVLFSRVFGLIREMIFAFFFGASAVYDAYLTAFRIPNLMRDLFAEGALSQAFVAQFSKSLSSSGKEQAWILANRTISFVLVFMGSITILGVIFSPFLVDIIAHGFDAEKYQLTVELNRILFPFILFVSLAALWMAMLNSFGRFGLPQSASTFFNISSVASGILLALIFVDEWRTAIFNGNFNEASTETLASVMLFIAGGTLFGGFVQWFVQFPSLRRLGFRFSFQKNFLHPDLLEVIRLAIPAIIAGAAVQVNVLINTFFASFLVDGSISWLGYAFRLMQFPIGVFGVSVALAATPSLAKAIGQKQTTTSRDLLQKALKLIVYLCLPASLGLIFFGEPIIELIYERGNFTTQDTLMTTQALQAYGIGLCFYALIKLYQPSFVAFKNAKTPMYISFGSILINFVLNYLFVFILEWGHQSLALATSLVAIINCLLLTFLMVRQHVQKLFSRNLVLQLFKIFVVAGLANGLGWLFYKFVLLDWQALKILEVFLLIALVGFTYLALSFGFKIEEAKIFLAKISQKLGRAKK